MQQVQSQHAHGSVARMEELYEVGEVIGTGTFGIIRKVSHRFLLLIRGYN